MLSRRRPAMCIAAPDLAEPCAFVMFRAGAPCVLSERGITLMIAAPEPGKLRREFRASGYARWFDLMLFALSLMGVLTLVERPQLRGARP
jgi:hypothetical protein